MEMNVLSARNRSNFGKGYARRLRQEGRAPAIAYAGGKDPYHLDVDVKDLLKVLNTRGKNTVFQLALEDKAGERHTAMLREMQRDPLSRSVLHADFVLIDLNKPVRASVKLVYAGRPVGVVQGGVLDVILRELWIECLPQAIPQTIEVDISHLGLNQALHVNEIKLPEGVKAAVDARSTMITISAPVGAEEEVEESATP